MIRERPAEVEDWAIPGHWKGDLITGSTNTHIATLVERHSRFTMLVKVKGKDTANVVTALTYRSGSCQSSCDDLHVQPDTWLLAIEVPGVVPGSLLGRPLNHYMNERTLKTFVALVLLGIGLFYLAA